MEGGGDYLEARAAVAGRKSGTPAAEGQNIDIASMHTLGL